MTDSGDALLSLIGRALDAIAPADAPLCVAFSGGMDSTVLLDLLTRLRPGQVRAVHVNHGLHPEAAAWAQACVARCDQAGVEFRVIAVEVPAEGGNLEARARDARYLALAGELREAELLVTAHHQQDQLETVLLALLRGSGVHGLAAMPARALRDGITQLRPLLDVSRELLADYATSRGLEWSEDPSNKDERFDRNYLRHQVTPLLQERWPAAAASIARSARLAAAAMRVLDERATADLQGHWAANALCTRVFKGLGEERSLNVLRRWCRMRELPPPTEAQSHAALDALLSGREDAEPLAAWPGTRIRRYRDSLFAYSENADPGDVTVTAVPWDTAASGHALDLGAVRGYVRLVPVSGAGLDAAALVSGVEVRGRSGGEQLRVRPDGPTRDLKKLLQEDGVLPWMRTNIPLIYVGGSLAAVGDLWLNRAHPAVVGSGGLATEWSAHSVLRSPF